jgi:hypothetical protein
MRMPAKDRHLAVFREFVEIYSWADEDFEE